MINTIRRNRRGTSTVEFAFIAPLVILLLLGGVELGRAVNVQHTLEEAARAGCRMYTIRETTHEQVEAVIDEAMANEGISGYTVSFDPATPEEIDEYLEPVTVSVTIPYSEVAWLPSSWFMGGKSLTGSAIMPADTGDIEAEDPPEKEKKKIIIDKKKTKSKGKAKKGKSKKSKGKSKKSKSKKGKSKKK